jgi:hypothetical protein
MTYCGYAAIWWGLPEHSVEENLGEGGRKDDEEKLRDDLHLSAGGCF